MRGTPARSLVRLSVADSHKRKTQNIICQDRLGTSTPSAGKTRSDDVFVFAGGVLNYKLFSAIRGALLYGGVTTICFSHLYMKNEDFAKTGSGQS
jgi:hypothetical protein